MPMKYPDEVKDRVVRMLLEYQGDYSSITATCSAVGPRVGIPRNTLRRWRDQARIDEGDKPGTRPWSQMKKKRCPRRSGACVKPTSSSAPS